MSLKQDWYVYHSDDEVNWVLQDGGPYTEEEALEAAREDEANRREITQRVAHISYPSGATPDKRIERTGLDLANQIKEDREV